MVTSRAEDAVDNFLRTTGGALSEEVTGNVFKGYLWDWGFEKSFFFLYI